MTKKENVKKLGDLLGQEFFGFLSLEVRKSFSAKEITALTKLAMIMDRFSHENLGSVIDAMFMRYTVLTGNKVQVALQKKRRVVRSLKKL